MPANGDLHEYLQELISRWDSEHERFYDDIVHVEASAYAHWTDFLSMLIYVAANQGRSSTSFIASQRKDEAGSRTSLQLIIYAPTPIKPNYQSLFRPNNNNNNNHHHHLFDLIAE